MHVFDALARARGAGRRAALVTVLSVEGEAPSHAGAKLVVGPDGAEAGTLGCAEFDSAGVDLAREALASGGTVRRRVVFGGHESERALELFAEVQEPEPAVIVIGSTPVGRAVAGLVRFLGRRAILVAPGGDAAVAPGVEVRADDPARNLLAAPPGPGDAVVVSDHDAPWVDEALRVALASAARYVGMLGSRRHAPRAVRSLRDAGVPETHIARLHSPCGLDIGSRTAEEIALSVVAEIVAVERGADGGSLRIDWARLVT
jgi:xanthine dehydrogenase accessory factor